jgi:5-methylcytosine-specific restriction endonuclease McrA
MVREHLRVVTTSNLPDPPYPAETRARGWKLYLDHERINQSDTWALAPNDMKPWLLMLWHVAWQQTPAGSYGSDDAVIAAKIGMDFRQFTAHRDILMRGWVRHSDGRLYHPVIAEQVQAMREAKRDTSRRQDSHRAKRAEIRTRDGMACVYCGSTKYLTVDHVVPRSLGGDNEPDNLVCSCKDCNSRKGERTPVDAGFTFLNKNAELLAVSAMSRLLGVTRNNALLLVSNAPITAPEPEPEPERKEKDRSLLTETTSTSGLSAVPYQEIVDAYHAKLPGSPRVEKITERRRGLMRQRWREDLRSIEHWHEYFEYVSLSGFLTGKSTPKDGRPPFIADFEWLILPTNYVKVLEKKYHRG